MNSTILAAGKSESRLQSWLVANWVKAFFLTSVVLGTFARILPSVGLPFWLDETFTATIATQPDFANLVRWCLTELTGPAFYMPMWLWAKLAGSSDLALRLPPLIISLATPLLVARYGHPDRKVGMIWGALCALWLPAIPGAFEARQYPQLFLLGCVQAMAFLAMIRSPRTIAALGWSAATTALVLTHYYGLVIGALQGLAFIAVHRKRAIACWPALAPFVLMAGWMIFHVVYLARFAADHVSIYESMPWSVLLISPMLVFGPGPQGYVIVGAAAYILLRDRQGPGELPERLLFWSGILALAIILAVGFWKAIFMSRYATPMMPAVLFGIALGIRREAPQWPPMAVRLVLVSLMLPPAAVLVMAPKDPRFEERQSMTIDSASQWIGERRPERLLFLWSSPHGAVAPESNLRDVGGFFFRRAGLPTRVQIVRGGADPNQDLRSVAGDDPRIALLWLSEVPLAGTQRPRIGRDDPSWECRDFSRSTVTVYACRR